MNPIEQGYITVADRLAAFVEKYPDGRIRTELVFSQYDPASAKGLVVVRAEVWKGTVGDSGNPDGTGLSSMPIPGVTNFTRNSEVENAETSAIGRALAAIGFLAKNPDGSSRISSSEEIAAKNTDDEPAGEDAPITQKQRGLIFAKAKEAGFDMASDEGKKMLQELTLAYTGKHSSKQLVNSDVDTILNVLKDVSAVTQAAGGGEVVA